MFHTREARISPRRRRDFTRQQSCRISLRSPLVLLSTRGLRLFFRFFDELFAIGFRRLLIFVFPEMIIHPARKVIRQVLLLHIVIAVVMRVWLSAVLG